MKHRKSYLYLITFSFLSLFVINSAKAQQYVESEKVFVTTDRHVYTPGERLSFSVFVVDEMHKVQSQSAMIKVLLVDGKDQVLDSIVAHVLNGRFSYFFMLPKTGGIYRIKASSRWQLNELKPKQFQKEIFVQELVQKRFFIKQDLAKTNYQSGDSVSSKISFTKRGDVPIAGARYEATLIIDGQPESSLYKSADEAGKSSLAFVLPNRKIETAYVKISVNYQGNTEFEMTRVPIQKNSIHMAAYTETGVDYLVAGVENRVVVESFDALGNPKDISGHVEDQNGKQIVHFKSLHKGLAEIRFTPKINQNYKVVSTTVKNSVNLPQVTLDKPYLKVQSRLGNLVIESVSSKARKTSVKVSGNGKVFLSKTISPQPGQTNSRVQIALSSLPPGVYGIQLKSEQGKVIGKRLFIRRPDALAVKIKTNTDLVNLGQEVTVNLNTNNETSTFAIRAISEQVFKQMKDRSHSIVSWMYMGSEILSDIEEPTYYFDENESNSAKALDLLGIVKSQQWRRDYSTGQVNRKEGKYFLRNAGRLGGTIYWQNQPYTKRAGIKVRIKNTSYEVLTDSLGRFTFEGLPADVISNSPILIVSKGVDRMEYMINQGYNYYNHGFSESTNNEAVGNVGQLLKKMIIPSQIDNVLKYKLERNDVKKALSYLGKRSASTMYYSESTQLISPSNLSSMVVYQWDFGVQDGYYSLYQNEQIGYVVPFSVSLNYNRSNGNFRTYPGPIRLSDKTTYWYGEALSNHKGESTLKFYTPLKNDGVVIICEGVTESGKLFVVSKTIKVQDAVEIFTNVPSNLTAGDYANVSLDFINHDKQAKHVEYTVYLNGKQNSQTVELPGNSNKAIPVNLSTGTESTGIQFRYSYKFDNLTRNSERYVIPILRKGHKRNEIIAGTESSERLEFEVSDVIDGTAEIQFNVLNNFIDVLEATSKRMIRQPGGCFEQVSSSNYPNLLALKVLRHNMDYVQSDLINKIQSGYAKLVAYETPSNGFEWYGRNPPHTTLSAYGLLQFSLMRELGLEIDEKMFNRNLNWLLSQRNGNGQFKHHRGKYGFSGSKDRTNDAYVTWVLSRITNKNIGDEIRAVENQVEKEFDAYKIALLAGIYANINQPIQAKAYLTKLEKHFNEKQYKGLKTSGSIMYSGGQSLDVEVMAIALLAAKKVSDSPGALENALITKIMQSQTGYGFGNTQATALALEALSNYVNYFKNKEQYTYTVWLDNEKVSEISTGKSQKRQQKIILSQKQISSGKHTLWVECSSSNQLPFTCEMQWLEQNEKVEHAELAMDYSFSKTDVTKSDEVIATVSIRNKTDFDKPQTVAVVKIPAGLTYSMEELRYLKKEGVFDQFESTSGQLVFYFLGLKANTNTTVQLSLKPTIEGRFAPAESYVYQYYTPEIRSTILAKSVRIRPNLKP